MDWDKAIERNEMALLRIVSAIFALLLDARLSGSGLMIPRRVWRAILIVLRPAEAAVRRLIIIAARHLKPVPVKSARAEFNIHTFSAFAQNPVPLAPAFNLFDPLKIIPFKTMDEEQNSAPAIPAKLKSTRRQSTPNPCTIALRALRHALADLPKQARRLARFNARRDALLKAGRPVRISPIRPGLPPGWHERGKHDVDTVLRECHRLGSLSRRHIMSISGETVLPFPVSMTWPA